MELKYVDETPCFDKYQSSPFALSLMTLHGNSLTNSMAVCCQHVAGSKALVSKCSGFHTPSEIKVSGLGL